MPLRNNGSAGFRAWPPETGCRGLLAGALLLSVAACATAEPVRERPPAGVTSASQLVLPFDAYKPTPEQQAVLGNAHNHLVVRCMSRRGLTVTPPAENAADLAAIDPGNSRRYGVVDTAAAQRYGYHLARPPSPDTSGSWINKLPKHTRHRLYGTAADRGCLDRASSALESGTRKADWPWLGLQDSLTLEQAAKHGGVTAATRRWQSCMTQAGRSYPDPEAAIADSRWDLEKPRVSEEEKQTAVADTTCKWSSGLVAAWFTADVELQRAVIRDNRDRFDALAASLRERLARASSLLSEHEGRQVG
ncbi:hypothetical protein DMB42_35155 [Nonomuraea sp. WAC 01424]|uniref:hypothetical protein n=1 Tax=Nonomuraea sp. WAC 01424 TaxID=2203200 RepID=UPI000F7B2C5E|nr:hypothetical protein [Nonomuraea sp. WAC 01424]RSN03076.1 hypothetical protein DMB42_35155 [Nonomuraea sp. WAC 01424]